MINKMRLLDVCDFQGGTQPPKNEWVSEPQEGYVRMLQIRDYSQGAEKFVEYVKNTGKLHMCSEDDIMLSRYGYIGQAFTGLAGAYNVALVKVIKKREIDTKYLFYYFQSAYFQHSLLSNVGSRATIPGFNKSELENTLIPIPSIDDQVKIGIVLSKLDKILWLHQEQLAKLDQLVKSRFIELFGDPYINDKNWIVDPLGNYMTTLTDFSANGSYELLDSNVIMYDEPNYAVMVRTTDLESGDLSSGVKYIDKSAYELLNKSKLFGGELIMNKIGSAGKIYIMPYINRPASLGRNAFMFRFDDRLNMKYLYFLLSSDYGTNEIQQYVRGAVTKTITKDSARAIKIIVPPIELQNQFAAFVDQTDKSKLAIQQSLDKLETLKKSLMQEYFG